MNAISKPAALTQDPVHLHLAAVAMAYTVRSGSLSYAEATDSLALAAIHEGLLERLSDHQFRMLRERLERSLVQATLKLDFRSADFIRKAIRRPIDARCSREFIEFWAMSTNELLGSDYPSQVPERALLPQLPVEAVREICRQEVRAAVKNAGKRHA